MSARAWVAVGMAGFWLAVLGLLIWDAGLAVLGVLVCVGSARVAVNK